MANVKNGGLMLLLELLVPLLRVHVVLEAKHSCRGLAFLLQLWTRIFRPRGCKIYE